MIRKGIIFLMLLALCGGSALAQGRKGLVINEILVQNDSNFVDDYGLHNAWIELYNSTYSPMEIGTIYITTDKNNVTNPDVKTMYSVPRGDIKTNIAPRQHTLFWADGEPERGTFHTNFKLNPGVDNWIGIFDSNGITLIDSITVPASLGLNESYARIEDGIGNGAEAWGVRHGSKADNDYISPDSNNVIKDVNLKKKNFKENDKYGVGMAIMAMSVVFLALLILCIAFKIIGKISARSAAKKKIATHNIEPTKEAILQAAKNGDSGEEIAAVCMALYEHLNAHDNEDMVLTINKVKKAYSPWSSKIYTLRDIPRR